MKSVFEAIVKLICPLKSPFWGHLRLFSSPNPLGVGLVEETGAASPPLANGRKIIDFPRQSSFAIASYLIPLALLGQEQDCIFYGNPSPPLCSNAFGLELVGEGLYMRSFLEGLNYAIRNEVSVPTATPGGPILDLDSTWQPAFRIGLSVTPQWTYSLIWLRLCSNMTTSAKGFELESTWVPAITSLVLYQDASLHWKLNVNTVDLEFGKRYEVSPFLLVHPACSLRMAAIDQSFHANYLASAGLDGAHAMNDFFAIGPRALLRSEWSFTSDWRLFAEGAISLLYGRFQTEFDFSSPNSPPAQLLNKINDHFYRLEPNADCAIGIGWDRALSAGYYRLGIRLSYEAHLFWDQNAFRQPLGSDAPVLALNQMRDLSIQGFALRGQLGF